MSLTIDIKRFAGMTEKQADQYVRLICLHLMSDVVLGTPVDTGRARGNWQASIGTPLTNATEKTDKDGNSTIASGSAAVKQATGNIFYLTNNLPYIYRLEFEGHSKQAPHGWVRAAVNRVSKAILS